jgi:hypothetical protein
MALIATIPRRSTPITTPRFPSAPAKSKPMGYDDICSRTTESAVTSERWSDTTILMPSEQVHLNMTGNKPMRHKTRPARYANAIIMRHTCFRCPRKSDCVLSRDILEYNATVRRFGTVRNNASATIPIRIESSRLGARIISNAPKTAHAVQNPAVEGIMSRSRVSFSETNPFNMT